MLEVEGLEKSFGGVRAVRGVSFAVAAGEIVALIGPNGAGKSTCFGMVGGQVRPDRGRVRLAGTEIAGLPARAVWRLGVGRTFQVASVFASMTAVENVQTALTARAGGSWGLFGPARARHRAAARALLAEVGLDGQAELAAGLLAYGDGKRLELAVALAGAPRLLLMDEPTAGMAPAERAGLMALVRRLVAERQLAVLFTEHDTDIVFGIADRVLVLDRGAVIAAGAPGVVRADARVREVYLGEEDEGGGSGNSISQPPPSAL